MREERSFWAIAVDESKEFTASLADIKLTTSRLPSLKEGDRFIAFTRKGLRSEFLWQAEISEVSISEKFQPHEISSRTKYEVILKFRNKKELDEILTIEDLRFSLTKVFNFDSPYRHFTLPYNRIKKEDFDTITRGAIYLYRTAFLSHYLALPTIARQRLKIDYLGKRLPEHHQSSGYEYSWQFLYQWIKCEYLDFFKVILATDKLASELEAEVAGFKAAEIAFSNVDSEFSENLRLQANAAAEAVENFSLLNAEGEGFDSIHFPNGNEKRLAGIFSKEDWVRDF